MASKIVRYEFLGSYLYVFLTFLFVVTIPIGIIYIITSTVRIDEDLENPSEFIEHVKSKDRSIGL